MQLCPALNMRQYLPLALYTWFTLLNSSFWLCFGQYDTRTSSSPVWRSRGSGSSREDLDPYHTNLPKGVPYPAGTPQNYQNSGRFGKSPPLGSVALNSRDDYRFQQTEYSSNNHIRGATRDDHPPPCARKRDYCLHNHDYPMDMMLKAISRHKNDMYFMYSQIQSRQMGTDVMMANRTYRYNFPVERGIWVCETDIYVMRIGWARNWAGKWKVVVNTDQFPQSVRVEHCKYENRSCQFMPTCVQSTCLQRYTAVQLLSVDPNHENQTPEIDTFLLPGGCSCFVEEFKFP